MTWAVFSFLSLLLRLHPEMCIRMPEACLAGALAPSAPAFGGRGLGTLLAVWTSAALPESRRRPRSEALFRLFWVSCNFAAYAASALHVLSSFRKTPTSEAVPRLAPQEGPSPAAPPPAAHRRPLAPGTNLSCHQCFKARERARCPPAPCRLTDRVCVAHILVLNLRLRCYSCQSLRRGELCGVRRSCSSGHVFCKTILSHGDTESGPLTTYSAWCSDTCDPISRTVAGTLMTVACCQSALCNVPPWQDWPGGAARVPRGSPVALAAGLLLGLLSASGR
ncbi:PREDICTED: glycosylphosphatidylinositol-anchored high density lipoprotein-binding protein 1 [Condylura cristata]|uniref:glycosylphosphatidylinositol-anchored high density lipoprotein-binding protein 1 n=1 Tax=Condylura cristata TaxID=143302 RepID=UPI000642A781|nr:PREDICTED: glycosylphosphatidylinositol-anchored high density lipoprotein-binding protein 1 [Condylura cristata]